MMYLRCSLLAAAATLAACANNGYCLRHQPYDNAQSVPPLVGTDELKIPESPNAMRVPDQVTNDAPYGVKVQDPQKPGRVRTRCLDQPPAFKAPPAAPESTPAPKSAS